MKAEVYTILGAGTAAEWATVAAFTRLGDAVADARARNLRAAESRDLTLRTFTTKRGWQAGWFSASKAGKDGQKVY